jgi:hypothetical protein
MIFICITFYLVIYFRIWEVDDDNDGCVSWDEFKLLIWRGRNDSLGCEPKKLFNVCQFICLDRDDDGAISTDECMEMIVHRYGRSKLDQIFQFSEPDREITMTEFLKQVHSSNMHHWMRRQQPGSESRPASGRSIRR